MREILVFPRMVGNTGNSREILVFPGKYWEIKYNCMFLKFNHIWLVFDSSIPCLQWYLIIVFELNKCWLPSNALRHLYTSNRTQFTFSIVSFAWRLNSVGRSVFYSGVCNHVCNHETQRPNMGFLWSDVYEEGDKKNC